MTNLEKNFKINKESRNINNEGNNQNFDKKTIIYHDIDNEKPFPNEVLVKHENQNKLSNIWKKNSEIVENMLKHVSGDASQIRFKQDNDNEENLQDNEQKNYYKVKFNNSDSKTEDESIPSDFFKRQPFKLNQMKIDRVFNDDGFHNFYL